MPERSTIAQAIQIGVETVPGTPVAATSRLGGLNITPAPSVEASAFRPTGLKFPALVSLNREWAEFTVDGTPTYEETAKMLSNCIGTPTIVQVMDGGTPTGAWEWTLVPSSTAADAPKTFTLEYGQSGVQAEQYAHMLGTGFSLAVSRTEVTEGGGGILQAPTTGFTPTGALSIPTSLTPMLPGHFSFYESATSAGLSAGKLLRAISAEASVEDRYNPAWFVNAAIQSFAAFVENPDGVGGTVSLTLEADSAGMAYFAKMRAGSTGFFRIEATGGADIYNAGTKPNLKHLFQWDLAYKVTNIDAMSDEDGIYAIPVTLQPIHDATWGKAMSFLVRNKVSTLS